jgi:DNA-binding MltR family transcriptional regulator
MDSEYTQDELDKSVDKFMDELTAFMVNLAQESDRSAVIIGAARLDITLERLLKRSMHNHTGGNDNLFDQDRPLSSFSAKIALAYRLGLLDRTIEHAMQMVRKIRNDFAHSFDNAKLTDGPIRNRVDEFVRQVNHYPRWQRLKTIYGERASSATLADFCAAISIVIMLLELGIENARPCSVPFTLKVPSAADLSATDTSPEG